MSEVQKSKQPKIHGQLHELEDGLIQIEGLLKALQQVLPDGAAHSCVANTLEERLERFQKQFYQHWKMLMNQ